MNKNQVKLEKEAFGFGDQPLWNVMRTTNGGRQWTQSFSGEYREAKVIYHAFLAIDYVDPDYPPSE